MPALREILPDRYLGEFMSLESQDHRVLQLLDRRGSSDFLIHGGDGMVLGASRQQPSYNFPTFTLRAYKSNGQETEVARLQRMIESGTVGPELMIQGYYDEVTWQLHRAAATTLRDLWTAYRMQPQIVRQVEEFGGGYTQFHVVKWSTFRDLGLQLWRTDKQEQAGLF